MAWEASLAADTPVTSRIRYSLPRFLSMAGVPKSG